MRINIEGQSLPAIYKRQGKECYLDPVRQKLIYITPEETVRQRMIAYLINELKERQNALNNNLVKIKANEKLMEDEGFLNLKNIVS